MKTVIIKIIEFYQVVLSRFLSQLFGAGTVCRYTPSCSQYAKESIEKYGIIKGVKIGLLRLLSCQPFSGTLNKQIT